MAGTERSPDWGQITDAEIERLRERVDVPRTKRGSMMRRDTEGEDAAADKGSPIMFTFETNGRFVRGISDTNPLYLDGSYAAKSIWGRTLVPPGILAFTELVNGASDGFPGCHTIWRECELEWDRMVFVNELMFSTTYMRDVRLVDSKFGGGRSAVQDYETTSVDTDDRRVGTYRTSWHRFARSGAKKAEKYVDTERPQWTDEALEEIWEEYRRQNLSNRRGADPLHWEDVVEGTDIPYLVKGPTTLTSKLAFESLAWPGGWVVGHELAMKLWQRYPSLPIRNEENVPEPPLAIHWSNERCQRYLGMPAAYEAGYERLNWLIQMLMHWIGDHGMPRKLSMRFEGFHWQGDVIRLHGRVTGKRVEGDAHLVDLDIRTVTHRDETTTQGRATVQLPSRETGTPVWSPPAGNPSGS